MAVWSDRAAAVSGVRVTVHVPEMAVAARIPDLRLAHPMVQPLPGGRVLVAGARCDWRPERNAIVYDAEGEAVAEQTFGDGIGHVQATGSGEIWVGCFERSGPVRFSADLTEEWRYPWSAQMAWGYVPDCYALNVDGDTAWACFYPDWPIVRIRAGGVTGWHNEIRSATALAIRGSRIALYGGYGPDRDRLVAGVLDGDRLRATGEYRLVLPDGQEVPREARVFGRGADLHVVTRDDWFRLSLEDLPG
ncbi:hypothetical protein [Amycolatopsis sp. GA6-003]|uniref:hypothetical protein n=1 Tax=Amycolatopsis sp. GA6-003 TaxID=2652444 RepID=UPI0039175FC2